MGPDPRLHRLTRPCELQGAADRPARVSTQLRHRKGRIRGADLGLGRGRAGNIRLARCIKPCCWHRGHGGVDPEGFPERQATPLKRRY